MKTHTVKVSFDDESASLDDVLGALRGAGYTVPRYTKVSGKE